MFCIFAALVEEAGGGVDVTTLLLVFVLVFLCTVLVTDVVIVYLHTTELIDKPKD